MKTRRHFLSAALCTLASAPLAAQDAATPAGVPPALAWEKIASLPARRGFDRQAGLGGAYTGAHGEALIIAGGTSFPGMTPWEGGLRAWWSDIYVLERTRDATGKDVYTWIETGVELPSARAYGASVSLPDGVLVIGGASFGIVHDGCTLLSWDPTAKSLTKKEYPALPQPLACHAAVMVDAAVFVIGGSHTMPDGAATTSFWKLDLKTKDTPDFKWIELPAWDGPARNFPVVASVAGQIYLCGGRNRGGDPDFLTDLHRYRPSKKDWSVLGDIVDRSGLPKAVMAAPAFAGPGDQLVVVGGMDIKVTKLLEEASKSSPGLSESARLASRELIATTLTNYQGYPKSVLGYSVQTGEWNELGDFPGTPALTNAAIPWGDRVVVASGETGPGRRSVDVWMARLK